MDKVGFHRVLAPSSSGLGHRPFKAAARVRIPLGLPAARRSSVHFRTRRPLPFFRGGLALASRTAAPVSAGRGSLLILLAAMLWGTTGTAQALAPVGATPLAVGTLRLAVGGGALVLVSALRGTLHVRHWRHPAALLAAAGVAGYQASFFGGVARTGVAVGTLVAIGSAPVIAGIVEDRKSTRLNSSHVRISYAVFCLKKKNFSRPSS